MMGKHNRLGDEIRDTVETVYRNESRRVLATLIRLLGDFDLAEDALQDAFAAAVEKWPKDGIPENPTAWLVSAGRFRAIDRIRRRSRFDDALVEIAEKLDPGDGSSVEYDETEMKDDRLRLIFTCCHPALKRETQIAMTLREVCGLTTEEIARAFLVATPTLAQRIVRAKRKIRDAGIPYEVPIRTELTERLDAVLHVVYLVYNEGYTATSGDRLTRSDFSGEAIHLGRMLLELLDESEVKGLLALMLLHESRREARTSDQGDLVLLSDQDRSKWDRDQIREGIALVEEAMRSRVIGPYTLQAAIAALHADSRDAESTDWEQIVALYDVLLQAHPSPVVELNRAVALAFRDGPAAGLKVVNALFDRGELEDYHLAHAARADFCRRLGMKDEARVSYRRALDLAQVEPERRFLEERLRSLSDS